MSAIWDMGMRTEVSGGARCLTEARSLKPTRLICSGTLTPLDASTDSTPVAAESLAANIAVGRTWRSVKIRCAMRAPSVKDKFLPWNTSDGSYSPLALITEMYVSSLSSEECCLVSPTTSPPTKAILRWPRSSRYSSAKAVPLAESTSTESKEFISGAESRNTMFGVKDRSFATSSGEKRPMAIMPSGAASTVGIYSPFMEIILQTLQFAAASAFSTVVIK